jgi:hypothetical protein
MIAHNIYFTLHDNSAAARQSLLDACHKYLAGSPGILAFHCGVLAADHVRAVNDRDFDVGLHVIFKDKAAHDLYQTTPDHNRFVAEMNPNWKMTRVFDTVVD